MLSAPSTAQVRRSSQGRQRALISTFTVLYSVTMPLLATAATPSAHPSSQALQRDDEQERGFLETIAYRLQRGGNALPRAPSIGEVLQQRQSLAVRQITTINASNNEGPEADQPITIGDVPLSPLLLIIAGMVFSLVCCLFLIVMIKCWNPNNSQTTKDRQRAHQDLRLRGAGRRSVAEPYVFGTSASGASTPNYQSARSSRIDKRPPPRPAKSGASISSRTPLYASHLSQASGSVAGSEHRLFPGAIKPGHNSFMSSSSGPFGDSQAALGSNADTGRYSDIVAGPSRNGAGGPSSYRPAPLPLPPMQQQAFNASHYNIPPGSPRGPRTPGYPSSPNKSSHSAKVSRSSTIGRGTDIHRQRGSKAFVPAVYPSAIAPAYPNYSSQNHHNAHPLDSSVELKRPPTDPTAGSGALSASRRNSMLSLSAGSNSNEGSSSPHLANINIGGGGTSPDSASSSHISTFSNGLTTNPLLPLGSSYLTSGAAGPSHGASTGDLLGTGYFGSTQARRSPGPSAAPPLPPQKSIYHTRPAAASGMSPAEYGNAVRQSQQQPLSQPRYDSKPLPGAVQQQSMARQRYDDDVEVAGVNVQSGLLQGEAAPRAGRYARRPGGPR